MTGELIINVIFQNMGIAATYLVLLGGVLIILKMFK